MAVETHRHHLGRLLDEATDALLALDEDGTIVVANAAAAARLGGDRRSLRGQPLEALVALVDRRAFRQAFRAVRSERPRLEVEVRLAADGPPAETRTLRLRRLRGGEALYGVRIDETRADTGDAVAREVERVLLRLPQAVIGVAADGRISFANARARRLLREPELRRGERLADAPAGIPLGRLVAQLLGGARTAPPQVVETSDRRSIRVTATGARGRLPAVLVLEDVTPQVGRARVDRLFVQNAAHQLRTPLAGIANAVELLQAGAKDDPVARDRFLAHLERETDRLARLARSLLVLARAQAGVQPPRLDFVELRPLLERVAALLAPARGVDVVVSCPPRLAALAEPDLLEEALTALGENAVRHTHDGAIVLRCRRRDDGTVAIEIEDSGEGIAPEHRELLFDPFFRATPDGEGFGLGLAIASQAVESLGAALSVDSSPQQGSTFAFTLPAAEVVRA